MSLTSHRVCTWIDTGEPLGRSKVRYLENAIKSVYQDIVTLDVSMNDFIVMLRIK